MQKRIWMLAGILTLVVAGTAVVVQAAPGGGGHGRGGGMANGAAGSGYMGGGRGMMGGGGRGMGPGAGGGMMGPGAPGDMPCLGAGGAFDQTAALAQAEAMLAQHKAYGATLQAQVDQATDAQVKAALAVRLERQSLMTGRLESHIAVLKTLTAETEPLQAALAVAWGDVAYWTKATATDTSNQALIAAQLARAQQRVEALEDQLAEAASATSSTN